MPRVEHVARRRARRAKKQGRALRPKLVAKARVKSRPKSRSGAVRRRLAAAALVGAFSLAPSGCGYLKGVAGEKFTYSYFRHQAERSVSRAASKVTDVVPGGGSVGSDTTSKIFKFVLGADPEAEIRRMGAKARFEYTNEGLPFTKDFWFEISKLNPKIKKDQAVIEFVERVQRNTGLFPAEIMLVFGAYCDFSVFNLRKKVQFLKGYLENTAKPAIKYLSKDARRFIPKTNRKREIVLEELGQTYVSRKQIALEYKALDGILRLMHSYPDEFKRLTKVESERSNPATCRMELNSYYAEMNAK